jgi:hypothetical protein
LKELRQRHGLTQEEFAEYAGISYKYYQQIEAGRKKTCGSQRFKNWQPFTASNFLNSSPRDRQRPG